MLVVVVVITVVVVGSAVIASLVVEVSIVNIVGITVVSGSFYCIKQQSKIKTWCNYSFQMQFLWLLMIRGEKIKQVKLF